ncbi:15601_t:CDS:2, partial [Funneliformis caledonium]
CHVFSQGVKLEMRSFLITDSYESCILEMYFQQFGILVSIDKQLAFREYLSDIFSVLELKFYNTDYNDDPVKQIAISIEYIAYNVTNTYMHL